MRFRLALPLGALAVALSGLPAAAQSWTVDPAQSSLMLRGQQGANTISITLPEWAASIAFDPNNLAATAIRVEITMGSLTSSTEDAADRAEEERELKGASWFDAASHPTAVFEGAGATSSPEGGLTTTGTLTLRGQALPATLTYSVDITGDSARAQGTATIRWQDYGIGWDPAQSGIRPEVTVQFDVQATRTP